MHKLCYFNESEHAVFDKAEIVRLVEDDVVEKRDADDGAGILDAGRCFDVRARWLDAAFRVVVGEDAAVSL